MLASEPRCAILLVICVGILGSFMRNCLSLDWSPLPLSAARIQIEIQGSLLVSQLEMLGSTMMCCMSIWSHVYLFWLNCSEIKKRRPELMQLGLLVTSCVIQTLYAKTSSKTVLSNSSSTWSPTTRDHLNHLVESLCSPSVTCVSTRSAVKSSKPWWSDPSSIHSPSLNILTTLKWLSMPLELCRSSIWTTSNETSDMLMWIDNQFKK